MYYMPKVVQAVAGDDYVVYAYFDDGTVRRVDVAPKIEKGGVFEPLRAPEFFRERLTVMGDTVAWDIAGNHDVTACVDLDPLNIYENCPVVDDPLKEAV
jgi:hypothetical protein